MKVIRIDDEVWAAMQQEARPLEDNPNSVLRRKYGIDKAAGSVERKKRATGARTPQSEYRVPILRALYECGGSAKRKDMLDRVGDLMRERLNKIDKEKHASGAVNWRNATEWERDKMVKDGLLEQASPRGVWELSSAGMKQAEKLFK